MVFARTNGNDSHSDRVVASAQDEIRRLSRDGGALQPEESTSLSSGLSIVGKIIGRGALTIFGHVEGELRASTVVIAEGAEMVGDIVAEELTVNGHVKGGINANRVRLNGTGVVGGIFSIAHWRSKRMLTPAANRIRAFLEQSVKYPQSSSLIVKQGSYSYTRHVRFTPESGHR